MQQTSKQAHMRLSQGDLGKKSIQAYQIDRHSCAQMLKTHFGQSIVASSPQTTAAHGLRDGSFNAGAQCILLAEGWSLLFLPTCLESLMGLLRTQR